MERGVRWAFRSLKDTYLEIVAQLDFLVNSTRVGCEANKDGQPLVGEGSVLCGNEVPLGEAPLRELHRPSGDGETQIDELTRCLEGQVTEVGDGVGGTGLLEVD